MISLREFSVSLLEGEEHEWLLLLLELSWPPGTETRRKKGKKREFWTVFNCKKRHNYLTEDAVTVGGGHWGQGSSFPGCAVCPTAAVIHSRSLHVHIHSPIHHQVTLSVLLESFSLLLMANASHRYIPYINNQIARTKPTEGVTIR